MSDKPINLSFAMVTAHQQNFKTQRGKVMDDFWNMYLWLHCFKDSFHFSFESLRENNEAGDELNKFDIVMFSGNPGYLNDIIKLAPKTNAVTIFFPEGDISLYNDQGIIPELIRAWNACSIVGTVEEDKTDFYEMLTYRPVKFLHIPVPDMMCNGSFMVREELKDDSILIYGDNNPNNPIIPIAIAKRLNLPVRMTAIDYGKVEFCQCYLGTKVVDFREKQDQYNYLRRFVAPSKVLIYPTRWIGTARQVISGALCGTPVIGNRDSHTQRKLFPMLGCYIYDMERMCDLTDKLYKDKFFYKMCVDTAFEHVKFYSMTNAKKRIIEAYESVRL